MLARAEIVCEKGTNRHTFCSGMVDRDYLVGITSSDLHSDLIATFLFP